MGKKKHKRSGDGGLGSLECPGGSGLLGLELSHMPSVLDELSLRLQESSLGLGPGVGSCAAAAGATPSLTAGVSLPDLSLGVKASYTTRQWRERERHMHRKALKSIKSPLALAIDKHAKDLERAAQIFSYGQSNKAKAMELELATMRQRNRELDKRIQKLQNTETEISAAKKGNNAIARVMKTKANNLSSARRAQQMRLDASNGMLLQRLAKARPTVRPRERLVEDYRHHRKICKNMCKLAVTPHQMRRMEIDKERSLIGLRRPRSSNNALFARRKRKRKARERYKANAETQVADVGGHGGGEGTHAFDDMASLLHEAPEEQGEKNEDEEKEQQEVQKGDHLEKEKAHGDHTHDVQQDEDKGQRQICHEWVELRHVEPGKQDKRRRALLVGFKHPNQDGKLLFEVTLGSQERRAMVSYDDVRAALNQGGQPSLAAIAAQKLTLFGADALLVWDDHIHDSP